MPHDQVDALAPIFLADRTATMLVSCAYLTCENSTIVARRLIDPGYTDVHDDAAGKRDWIGADYPVESGLLNHVG